jgi:acetylornithine deacetylase/succinyl-diaminopimelate desuccinylase-like protein
MIPIRAETLRPGEAAAVGSSNYQQLVANIAGTPLVEAVIDWFQQHRQELLERQIELAQIPAPPFGEADRVELLRQRFERAGLESVHIDEIGNVLGIRRGRDAAAKYVALTAHVDTVFPAGTPVEVRRNGDRVHGPGVSDNCSGMTALLALAGAMNSTGLRTDAPLLFVGNVGEEGEGDVRGMRHIFSTPKWRDTIAFTLVVDGAGTDSIVTEGLGSKRFVARVLGPGGHSWSDFGIPNPIMVLSRALEIFRRTHIPASPKTTFNVGVISGGTSVNSIPESVSMRVDIRSVSSSEVDRLERALREALEQAIQGESPYIGGRRSGNLSYEMKLIGSRPAARLKADSQMLAAIRAVDAFLGNKARVQRASTDANIPISLGQEAVAIGAGGSGGGAHTLHEWYDATGREFGLKRILLTVLLLAGISE